MLLRYLLFFLLLYAAARFVGAVITYLGGPSRDPRRTAPRPEEEAHLAGRDVEDAEFEIVPEDQAGEEEDPGPAEAP